MDKETIILKINELYTNSQNPNKNLNIDFKEKIKMTNEYLDFLTTNLTEDFVWSLSPQDLLRIPLPSFLDFGHIIQSGDFQEKILNKYNKLKNLSKEEFKCNNNYEKFCELANSEYISFKELKEFECFRFSAESLLCSLLEYKAVKKVEDKYKIVSVDNFQKVGKFKFVYDSFEEMSTSIYDIVKFVLVEDNLFIENVNKYVNTNIDLNWSIKEKMDFIDKEIINNKENNYVFQYLVMRYLTKMYEDNVKLYLTSRKRQRIEKIKEDFDKEIKK